MSLQLLQSLPNGTIFYEDDITAPQLLQKVENTQNDIVIRQFDADFEQYRLGLREMTTEQQNSKIYKILDAEALAMLQQFVGVAELAILQN